MFISNRSPNSPERLILFFAASLCAVFLSKKMLLDCQLHSDAKISAFNDLTVDLNIQLSEKMYSILGFSGMLSPNARYIPNAFFGFYLRWGGNYSDKDL